MCPFPVLLARLDQRFPPPQEVAFKKEVEPKLVFAFAVAASMFLFVLGANTMGMANDLRNPDSPLEFSSSDPRTWGTVAKIFLAFLAAMSLVMCLLRLRRGWLASWNWELQVLMVATLAMVVNAFNPSRRALLLGLQPEQVYTYDTRGDECNEMLVLDAFTTGLCIFMPIRSCVLWVAPVSGLLMHIAMRASVGPEGNSSWYDVITLAVLAFFSLVGAFKNERTARERFLAVCDVKVQEQRLSSQYLAMSRILARFCDCVLELDGDFRFCGPHPQFAAIVFSSVSTSLDGGSFLDHLASGQRSFVELLSKNTPLHQVSDMVPLLFKDSQGREFAAQAYCTCYEDRKGRHYFVGVTETQERMPQEACLAPLPDFNEPERRASVCKCSKSCSNSESSGSYSLQEVSEKEDISFAFLDDEDFSLVNCSPEFSALGGPFSQEQPLKWWMRPQELQRFSNWAQEVGNMFRQYQTLQNVILSPPHTERADVEYVVELSLSFLEMTNDCELVFHVSVEEIRQRRQCRGKKGRLRVKRRGPLKRDVDPEAKPPNGWA